MKSVKSARLYAYAAPKQCELKTFPCLNPKPAKFGSASTPRG